MVATPLISAIRPPLANPKVKPVEEHREAILAAVQGQVAEAAAREIVEAGEMSSSVRKLPSLEHLPLKNANGVESARLNVTGPTETLKSRRLFASKVAPA